MGNKNGNLEGDPELKWTSINRLVFFKLSYPKRHIHKSINFTPIAVSI